MAELAVLKVLERRHRHQHRHNVFFHRLQHVIRGLQKGDANVSWLHVRANARF